MPIYAYRCESCGFAKDVLQKISDAPLTACPSCAKDTFKKQLTAAGFQLKGTGWYVTDFRNNGGGTASPAKNAGSGGTGGDSAASSSNDGASAAPATPPAPAA
ncbi:FmdB family zinc ribbon protein [Noviherbaspirillum galbum]|uniref:Zinc ribbon domain-containing protein n=1 Tax=Noviherbaspirillum galbum TaxID=2709383 RepID=A0A6B3SV13_9BURK|nr:FmdB family zinc ribbon protein [Noviherbaspirillum galbum]NEX64361.1 zinc ribbon domain-containing protein [Noviherbaspirillum galbum]